MSNHRIGQEEVFEAANTIVDGGERPSVPKVHRILGRGSYTTISKYLKEFFQSSAWRDASINQPLPEELPLTNAAKEAFEQGLKVVWHSAEKAAMEMLSVRTKEVEKQLDEQEHEIEIVINSNHQLQNQITTHLADIKKLSTDLDTAHTKNGGLEEKVTTLSASNTDLKAEIESLKKQLVDQADLQEQLKASELECISLNEQLIDANAQKGSIELKLTETESSLNTTTAELKDSLKQCTTLASEIEKTNKDNATLNNKLTKATAERDASKEALAVANKGLETNTKKLEEALLEKDKAQELLIETSKSLATNETALQAEKVKSDNLSHQLEKIEMQNVKLEKKVESKDEQIEKLQVSLRMNVRDYVAELSS